MDALALLPEDDVEQTQPMQPEDEESLVAAPGPAPAAAAAAPAAADTPSEELHEDDRAEAATRQPQSQQQW
jgi:hypothetical protein